jgi:hypothetical protein
MIEVGKVTAIHGLHLREKANKTSAILATLPLGTSVTIVGRAGNWLQVNYNFKTGYIFQDYVTVTKVKPPDLDLPYDELATPLISWKWLITVIVVTLAALATYYGLG